MFNLAACNQAMEFYTGSYILWEPMLNPVPLYLHTFLKN